ncbi:hypothetical protein EJ05DRAFT_85650 [Pseudovirgaria hyperparasitica]|uniref:Mannosyltransferase n=1 Tax=Pseudovirgaria hyperparasitica TaxID=470096 RepID=A0A6A6W0D5_9PEZI|nr:uncharacterized protein EJ05DRAFT_85650 [Pseudovirgaria hyperparasitica]KAF2756003.1 hypothetical protein EJ05DRAFT_85650 [Pseudovirgaria hyperparasitica]
MWRRTYLLLILVRLWFALSPSYLHPDENFQGPEVIAGGLLSSAYSFLANEIPCAGRVFSYQVHLTWEFTSENPIRSSFPLWLTYGLPMYILHWIWEGAGKGEVPPFIVYWVLRIIMFTLSFVLEDWAIHELVQSPSQRRRAVLLVASSYVTWTLQTHTFSNSIETLVLAWSMVLIHRIVEDKERSSALACTLLGFLSVLGVFNRITFPAFLLVPGLQLCPHFKRKPFSLLFIILSVAFTTFLAIGFDTAFYQNETLNFIDLVRRPVITPLNNLIYNSSSENLAQHGLHPYYQHIVANLPQLLGPAFPLLFLSYRKSLRLASAVAGILLLSLFPHQEARFLLPTIPLILSSIRLPKYLPRLWLASWIIFNAFFGILMGVYHQGGVVPAQNYIAASEENISHVFWWKTYSPPVWLLDGKSENLSTIDLMGLQGDLMVARVQDALSCDHSRTLNSTSPASVYLVAPRSAYYLKPYIQGSDSATPNLLHLEEVWSHTSHLNLDDLDFGDDGIWPTLSRVVGDRGLVIWEARKSC